jgi:cysteine desulfurase/selenocysteine lyase
VQLDAFLARFPALAGRTYLNAASEGVMPGPAVGEAEKLASLEGSPWEIGVEHWYLIPAGIRSLLEKMIGAPPGSVALVSGTSAGIGLAARGLPLGPGDELLMLDAQFPSNLYPWRAAAARGVRLRVVPRPLGTDPTRPLLDAISAATRAVAIDWVNFVDGAVVDLAALGTICRERSIFLVVDAAQGLGALPIDVTADAIDLLAAPSHKWLLGPAGTGFVYVAPRLTELLQPWNAGWVNIAARAGFRNLLRQSGEPPPDATRFEVGSPPRLLLSPWKAALELLAEAGQPFITGRILDLASRLREGLEPLHTKGITVVSPPRPSPPSGILSFHSGESTTALFRRLEAEAITVVLREGVIRVSPHAYNRDADIDALVRVCASF